MLTMRSCQEREKCTLHARNNAMNRCEETPRVSAGGWRYSAAAGAGLRAPPTSRISLWAGPEQACGRIREYARRRGPGIVSRAVASTWNCGLIVVIWRVANSIALK